MACLLCFALNIYIYPGYNTRLHSTVVSTVKGWYGQLKKLLYQTPKAKGHLMARKCPGPANRTFLVRFACPLIIAARAHAHHLEGHRPGL